MEAKKKAHPQRKNGASREAWMKAKAAQNESRGPQLALYVAGILGETAEKVIRRRG